MARECKNIIVCLLISFTLPLVFLGGYLWADQEKFSVEGDTLIYNSNWAANPLENFIMEDDVQNFIDLLKRDDIRTIRLTSPGGERAASIDIADIIMSKKLNTEASGNCLSGCTRLFIAGKKRTLLPEAKLGFHSHSFYFEDFESTVQFADKYFKELDFENTLSYLERLMAVHDIKFYNLQGISLFFSLKVMTIHPHDAWYPTREELEKHGVLRRGYDG